MSPEEIMTVIEAVLFVSDGPQPLNRIAESMENVEIYQVSEALKRLQWEYETANRALQVVAVAGGFQMVTRSELKPYLDRFFERRRKARISGAALETLAIIAYRQPITRAEIEAIRGVNVDNVVHTLLERRLIKIAGRKEVPGHPFLYQTTKYFLEHFGLHGLKDLPHVEQLSQAYEDSGAQAAEGEPEAARSETGNKSAEESPSAPEGTAEPDPGETTVSD